MEKISDIIGRILFGKTYYDGFYEEKNEDKYILTSVFPNKEIMDEAYLVLQETEKRENMYR